MREFMNAIDGGWMDVGGKYWRRNIGGIGSQK
jgi:hypothetical protein